MFFLRLPLVPSPLPHRHQSGRLQPLALACPHPSTAPLVPLCLLLSSVSSQRSLRVLLASRVRFPFPFHFPSRPHFRIYPWHPSSHTSPCPKISPPRVGHVIRPHGWPPTRHRLHSQALPLLLPWPCRISRECSSCCAFSSHRFPLVHRPSRRVDRSGPHRSVPYPLPLRPRISPCFSPLGLHPLCAYAFPHLRLLCLRISLRLRFFLVSLSPY